MRRKNGVPMAKVLSVLSKHYTPPKTFLEYRTPLDLLLATILSAQCTDVQVNKVTKTILFPKYKTAQDYLRVSEEELMQDIRTTGHFQAKARYLRGTCKMIIEDFGGEVPNTMEQLTMLPGVGRKTASCVLSAIFDKHEGIAVDTHVMRVGQRLGLTDSPKQDVIERDLMEQAPQKEWGKVTTLLISLGRDICTARDRKCERCPFQTECPSSKILGRPDLAIPKLPKMKGIRK